MKTMSKALFISFAIISLSACTSMDARLEKEFETVRRGPVNAPYKSITNFSHALQCMDQLMLKAKIKNIPILIEAIDDKTETVKAGTREMLISAISEMTAKSHGIKVIAYGKDAANLISYLKSARQKDVYATIPRFDIHGSITQHDESIVGTGSSVGLFRSDEGGFGAAKSISLSVIALDLNVLDTRDMSVLPGNSSHNSITILKRGKSLDADASISKFGVYFDISMNRAEGKSQGVRNLVELGAIEIVGKLVNVPYWRCLGASDDKAT
ncbi:hypothetical protein EOL70_10720 [Leucothrix sargassi]|nr:hypothetical protein EOL70_10720 [Leucothrix sargassi]